MNLRNFKWLVMATTGAAVLLLVLIAVPPRRDISLKRFLKEADCRQERAFASIGERNLHAAASELSTYLNFLEEQRNRLLPYRDVEWLSYLAHLDLAYILMCSEERDGALEELRSAYVYHQKSRAKAGMAAIPKKEFPRFVADGVWNSRKVVRDSGHQINTNFLREISESLVNSGQGSL
jgi:hypothetical protein